MTFLLNLDEFGVELTMWFRGFIELSLLISIAWLIGSAFSFRLKTMCKYWTRISVALSAMFYVSGNMLSSHIRFKYLKILSWAEESSRVSSDVARLANLNAEMHVYVGCVASLLFILLSLSFWIREKGSPIRGSSQTQNTLP